MAADTNDVDDVDEVDDQGLSRRTALKGLAAAGAAGAWTVPTILSATSAAAGSTPTPTPTIPPGPCLAGDCGPDPCFDSVPSGTDTGTGNPCLCMQDPVSGVCVSAQVVPCSSVSPCVNGVCPPGYACLLSCCGGTLCFPICA
jgi:hypothetical protein